MKRTDYSVGMNMNMTVVNTTRTVINKNKKCESRQEYVARKDDVGFEANIVLALFDNNFFVCITSSTDFILLWESSSTQPFRQKN